MKKITLLITILFFTLTWEAQAQFPEGFEGATFPPTNWVSFIGTNGEGTVQDWTTSATAAGGSTMSAYVKYENVANAAEDWLVTPQFTPSATANILSFSQKQEFTSDYSTTYTIRVSTASQTTHADFTIVDTQAETDFSTSFGTHYVDLSAYNGQAIYVAFVMDQDDGDSWYVDNVDLIANANAPDCATDPVPSDAAVDVSAAGGAATLSWTAAATGDPATDYEVFIGTTSGSLNSIATVQTTSIDLTGVDYSTTYYWMVVPKNVGGSATGCAEWSFTTEAEPSAPANDDCSGAITLTVNGDLACGTVTAGTIQSATDSGVTDNGAGTPNDDVWFSFVATSTTHRIELTNKVGTYTDLVHELMSGPCASLTSVNVSDSDLSTVSNLTIGDTYYIRVFGYSSTAGRDTIFDICIGTPPSGPANDTMAGAIPITPSAEGTGCSTPGFTLTFSSDGTTDSGMDGTCNTTNTGLDQFFTWNASSLGLAFNSQAPGNPGIIIRDTSGNEIACLETFSDDQLSGWAIGDDLIIQIYDYGSSISDVAFCLEEVSCVKPTNAGATNITTNSVDLTWNSNSMTAWDIEYGPDGFTQGTGGTLVTNTSDNPYSLMGLSENTAYDFYVRSNCGATSSDWVGPISFTTELSAIVPDYTNDFATYPGDGWSEAQGALGSPSGSSSGWGSDDFANDTNHANGTSARLNIYGTSRDEYLISPSFNISGATFYLNFDIALTEWSNMNAATLGADDYVALLISDNGGAWTELTRWDSTSTISNTGMSVTEIPLTGYSTVKFAIYGYSDTSNEDNDFFLDNFKITTNSTASVKENAIEGFSMYPNPTKDILKLNAQEQIQEVSVYNLLGQKVMKFTPNTLQTSINIGALNAGIYVLKVKVANKVGSYRVMKE